MLQSSFLEDPCWQKKAHKLKLLHSAFVILNQHLKKTLKDGKTYAHNKEAPLPETHPWAARTL